MLNIMQRWRKVDEFILWTRNGYHISHIYSSPLNKMAAGSADNIFKCIFMNEKFCISIQVSLKFVPQGPINNKSALVQVMAWCQTGSPTHICSTGGDEWMASYGVYFQETLPFIMRYTCIAIIPNNSSVDRVYTSDYISYTNVKIHHMHTGRT